MMFDKYEVSVIMFSSHEGKNKEEREKAEKRVCCNKINEWMDVCYTNEREWDMKVNGEEIGNTIEICIGTFVCYITIERFAEGTEPISFRNKMSIEEIEGEQHTNKYNVV